jgi:bifunctional UDP-N-acetylglucosamine pyrophosphorylase/glucosamine-1-phosphate N-acetyltransferase
MSTVALVLAAGQGTRMKSELPKVAHRILGVPMVRYVVDSARQAGVERVLVVTGHGAEDVEALLEGTELVRQEQQLGTGHAVLCASEALSAMAGSLVVLSGDTPLLRADTIAGLVAMRESSGAAAVVLTAHVPDPTGYGRIVRDRDGEVAAIVEQKDATSDEVRINEVNTGTYCFDARVLLAHLDRLDAKNAQGEYYLTDVIGIMVGEGLTVGAMTTDEPLETLGVNSRVQLAEAAKAMQARINTAHMLEGVTMIDPELVWVGPDVTLAPDVELLPMTFLEGATSVASGAVLGPNARVRDSRIGERAVVDASVVVSSVLGPGVNVGPVAYVRPNTVLEAGSKAGTCVEIKNSTIGEGSKVPHLSYVGDAQIGRGVNVGAGTITCNYDGTAKHPTVIEDDAFIGSDTMLVAPVRVGRGAVTGAGSAISHDVPANALGIERSEQRIIEEWAVRRADRSKDTDDTSGGADDAGHP